jgi:hypothetical protein
VCCKHSRQCSITYCRGLLALCGGAKSYVDCRCTVVLAVSDMRKLGTIYPVSTVCCSTQCCRTDVSVWCNACDVARKNCEAHAASTSAMLTWVCTSYASALSSGCSTISHSSSSRSHYAVTAVARCISVTVLSATCSDCITVTYSLCQRYSQLLCAHIAVSRAKKLYCSGYGH